MLDFELIVRCFSLFSDLTGDSLDKWLGLCEQAGARVAKRIRTETEPLDRVDMERLCCAAAAIAYADYLMMQGGGTGSADEVRVGDISVKSSSHELEQDARDIVNYYMEQVADLLTSPTQALWGVA